MAMKQIGNLILRPIQIKIKIQTKILPTTISEAQMASSDIRSVVLTILAVVLLIGALYLIDPTLFGLLGRKENFEGTMGPDAIYRMTPGQDEIPGADQEEETKKNPNVAGFEDASGSEGFANSEDVTGPAAFESPSGPAGCYPRDQLTPGELLPKDQNSVWSQQNPMGTGSLKGKNFLSAGALIGINTVGQSMRNANYQLRSEPPNPQVAVSIFNQSTISPDFSHRPLEIGA